MFISPCLVSSYGHTIRRKPKVQESPFGVSAPVHQLFKVIWRHVSVKGLHSQRIEVDILSSLTDIFDDRLTKKNKPVLHIEYFNVFQLIFCSPFKQSYQRNHRRQKKKQQKNPLYCYLPSTKKQTDPVNK